MPKTAPLVLVSKKYAAKRKGIAPTAKAALIKAALGTGMVRQAGYFGRFNGKMDRELKFLDTTLSFNVDLTGEVPATGQLNLIPQGDTESTRDGYKVLVKSIAIKAFVQLVPGAAALASATAYIYLVQDTQCNGAAAAATDVLTSASFPLAHSNVQNAGRFRILKKWTMDFNPGASNGGTYNTCSRHIDFYKRLDVPISFNGATGAITEIKSNNLFLLAGAASLDDLIQVNGSCRIRYYD